MLLMKIKRFFLLCILFLWIHPLSATHLVGGEIYYDCLGNDNYRITLKVYRDCSSNNSNGTPFDAQAAIGIYNNGTLITTLLVPLPGSVALPVVINNPCLQVPPNICIEEAKYVTTTTLPPVSGGYDIVYQRCCRNPAIQNIVTPDDYGNTYLAHIPEASVAPCNSSPRFSNYPPLVLCSMEDFVFDHSAIDPDGDLLVYEMCNPLHGGTPANPAPNPPLAPPYSTIIWNPGYNVNNQIMGAPTLSVNSATGLMTGTPTLTGNFVVGVCVKEYRAGVLINSTLRDFQFLITNCNPITAASIPTQSNPCNGLTVNLDGSGSINAQTFSWDFGDGTTSTVSNPTHTYAQGGSYTITLIVNAGLTCADTATVVYNMVNPLMPQFIAPGPQCITGNSFNFQGTGAYNPAITSFQWDFGSFATPSLSTNEFQPNVVFSDSGHYAVSFTVNQFGCTETYTDTVIVFPIPEMGADMPPGIGCVPYTITFQDTTLSWTPVQSFWTFGDGNVSSAPNPTHTYTNVGDYDITYTITIDSGCIATQTLSFPGYVVVNPSPEAAFEVTPTQTNVFFQDFEISDLSSGAMLWYYVFPSGDTIFQRDGPFKTDTSGYQKITQWVWNEFGCPDSASKTIFIEPITTIYIPNAFTPGGNGINDTWKPIVKDVTDYEIFVYNRWGNVVFHSSDSEASWDGTFKGEKCPVDVYVWKLWYRPVDNILRTKTGHVSIIR